MRCMMKNDLNWTQWTTMELAPLCLCTKKYSFKKYPDYRDKGPVTFLLKDAVKNEAEETQWKRHKVT